MKYQYTNFIYPYTIDEHRYGKYLLRLLNDKNCKLKLFEKEKDLDIYNFFLPNIRDFLFQTFELRGEKLKDFNNMSNEMKSNIISKQNMVCFEYYLDENIQGKVGEEGGIFFAIENVEIICFSTGICFLTLKTHIDGTDKFEDVLDFNYRFKSFCSEFYSLKNFENINIQSSTFKDIISVKDFIKNITGISHRKKLSLEQNKLEDYQFYNYSYVCIENDKWNEKTDFSSIENEFLKYSNVLPSKFSANFDKENINQNLHQIEKMKYFKISVTKTNCNVFCSGIDTYNYTKLPYEYENQYFYTYILELYKKIYLMKLNLQFKNYSKLKKLRHNYLFFTRNLWQKEITADDTGTIFFKTIEETLELENLYSEIKTKYEVIYKDLNIDKNNKYYTIIVILLIISLLLIYYI